MFVIAPLRDFQRADEGGNGGPLAMALLRIWLFGIYLSSMESFFLDRADPIWFTFLFAVFGLHYPGALSPQGLNSSCGDRFASVAPPAVEIERHGHAGRFAAP